MSTMSAPEYAARARETRAFCPPLRLMPFSPISVSSPFGSISRSGSRQHALTISRNLRGRVSVIITNVPVRRTHFASSSR